MTLTKKQREVRIQKAFHDLVEFVDYMAYVNSVKGHWMLEKEELIAESYFVLAKVGNIERYDDQPYEDFLKILKTSVTNALKTLRYKGLITGRKHEFYGASLQEEAYDDGGGGVVTLAEVLSPEEVEETFNSSLHFGSLDPEYHVFAAGRFSYIISKLDETDKKVLDAILGGNEKVARFVKLQRQKRNFVYDNPKIRMNPLIISRALDMTEKEVKASMERISGLL